MKMTVSSSSALRRVAARAGGCCSYRLSTAPEAPPRQTGGGALAAGRGIFTTTDVTDRRALSTAPARATTPAPVPAAAPAAATAPRYLFFSVRCTILYLYLLGTSASDRLGIRCVYMLHMCRIERRSLAVCSSKAGKGCVVRIRKRRHLAKRPMFPLLFGEPGRTPRLLTPLPTLFPSRLHLMYPA